MGIPWKPCWIRLQVAPIILDLKWREVLNLVYKAILGVGKLPYISRIHAAYI